MAMTRDDYNKALSCLALKAVRDLANHGTSTSGSLKLFQDMFDQFTLDFAMRPESDAFRVPSLGPGRLSYYSGDHAASKERMSNNGAYGPATAIALDNYVEAAFMAAGVPVPYGRRDRWSTWGKKYILPRYKGGDWAGWIPWWYGRKDDSPRTANGRTYGEILDAAQVAACAGTMFDPNVKDPYSVPRVVPTPATTPEPGPMPTPTDPNKCYQNLPFVGQVEIPCKYVPDVPDIPINVPDIPTAGPSIQPNIPVIEQPNPLAPTGPKLPISPIVTPKVNTGGSALALFSKTYDDKHTCLYKHPEHGNVWVGPMIGIKLVAQDRRWVKVRCGKQLPKAGIREMQFGVQSRWVVLGILSATGIGYMTWRWFDKKQRRRRRR
jgi:hypothetical protein